MGLLITGSYADRCKPPLLIAVGHVLRLWVEDRYRPLCDSRNGKLHAGKLSFMRDGAGFALGFPGLGMSC